MKKLITIAITLIVLLGVNYAITLFTIAKFVDYSFIVGIAVSGIIWFFTSKGGFTSRNMELTVQGMTGVKVEKQKYEFSPNVAFFTALAYSIISFVIILVYYRNYLFGK
jgi:hypothetical protein